MGVLCSLPLPHLPHRIHYRLWIPRHSHFTLILRLPRSMPGLYRQFRQFRHPVSNECSVRVVPLPLGHSFEQPVPGICPYACHVRPIAPVEGEVVVQEKGLEDFRPQAPVRVERLRQRESTIQAGTQTPSALTQRAENVVLRAFQG